MFFTTFCHEDKQNNRELDTGEYKQSVRRKCSNIYLQMTAIYR